MSTNLERPPDAEAALAISGGLDLSPATENVLTLAALPLGARLVLRCRKDWRAATIVAISPEEVTLAVGSPSGHTYRVRRPPDTALSLEGSIPVLGEGQWRLGFVRYDARW